jgi:hypothetical protein
VVQRVAFLSDEARPTPTGDGSHGASRDDAQAVVSAKRADLGEARSRGPDVAESGSQGVQRSRTRALGVVVEGHGGSLRSHAGEDALAAALCGTTQVRNSNMQ